MRSRFSYSIPDDSTSIAEQSPPLKATTTTHARRSKGSTPEGIEFLLVEATPLPAVNAGRDTKRASF